MSRLTCAAIGIAVILPTAAAAQVETASTHIPGTFEMWQAVEAALSSPELDALRREHEAARARTAQAPVLSAPVFELQALPWFGSAPERDRTTALRFTIGQQLPGRGKRDLGVALGEKESAVASARLAMRGRTLVAQAKHAYVDLWLARRRRDIVDASLPMLRDMSNATEARFVGSRGSQREAVQAVAEMTRRHHELIAYEGEARAAETRLDALLFRGPGRRLDRLSDLPERRLVVSAERLTQMALAAQPELWDARASVDREEAARKVIETDAQPDYMVRGGYMAVPGTPGSLTASVAFTWPNAPWSRRRISAELDEISARSAAARAQVRVVENRIRARIYDAYSRARTAEDHVALIRTTLLPQLRHSYEVTRVAYESDRGSFADLIESQRVLLTAQLGYHGALVDLHHALIDLEAAIGRDLPADFLQPIPAVVVPATPVATEQRP